MAVEVSLELQGKNGAGEIVKKTISDINPAATDSQLDATARALNNLTANTYVDSIRVERKSINDALD